MHDKISSIVTGERYRLEASLAACQGLSDADSRAILADFSTAADELVTLARDRVQSAGLALASAWLAQSSEVRLMTLQQITCS